MYSDSVRIGDEEGEREGCAGGQSSSFFSKYFKAPLLI